MGMSIDSGCDVGRYVTLKGGRGNTILTISARARIGDHTYISARQADVQIGSSLIAPFCWLAGPGDILIEDSVMLGPSVVVASGAHEVNRRNIDARTYRDERPAPVLVKSGAWIGAHSTLRGPLTIGRGAVVGANSVVTQDVPDYAVVAGIPARRLH